ncbi:hypothetical protein HH310_14885 [Actinoplanes sp. TBRC 11911]|uniref:hypothetical protein n=1 Tax=Actinoplanes sp. TBRC 11911 TaxID=2729386 RepID=UPI00145CCEFA|nr:hypothetical protein [Actinoplanes sp. TBRC 11911]NMO52473.1 hypothetical protein [Actinoplanes sp. TBRC 11911]
MADIQFPNALFAGTFTAQIIDPSGAPVSVVDADGDFQIKADWDVGALAALFLAGEFTVKTYVESIGPGEEKEIATGTQAVNGSQLYSKLLNVPAGTLKKESANDSGVYKVVTLLTHRNSFGTLTTLAAIEDGPVVYVN